MSLFMHRRHCVKRVCHMYLRLQDTDDERWRGEIFRNCSALIVAEAAWNIPPYAVYSKQPGSGGRVSKPPMTWQSAFIVPRGSDCTMVDTGPPGAPHSLQAQVLSRSCGSADCWPYHVRYTCLLFVAWSLPHGEPPIITPCRRSASSLGTAIEQGEVQHRWKYQKRMVRMWK